MAVVNYARKEIHFKVVYYGPALGGKTTSLAYIHSRISAAHRGELISLATSADRTLFFDFLPLNTIVLQGFRTKFQLYTVPGQVIYNATRQLVLRGVDGVVFIADSQWERMEENVASFRNLEENLQHQQLSLDSLPYVLQFNKRDLANVAPTNYLDYLLNNRQRRIRSFPSQASSGRNIFAALDAVTQMLLHKFDREHQRLSSGPVARENRPTS
jgi:signal recognition particle receptor subunit beta